MISNYDKVMMILNSQGRGNLGLSLADEEAMTRILFAEKAKALPVGYAAPATSPTDQEIVDALFIQAR